MKHKLIKAAVAVAAAVGLVFTATVPAQAFAGFTTSNWACWTPGMEPRLDVQNPATGTTIYANMYDNSNNVMFRQVIIQPGNNVQLRTTYANGGATAKSVRVVFSGGGNLNWWYQQLCVYV